MREAFIDKRFNASSRAVIDYANIIIAEHQAEGYTLTLRQLYYQFVHRKLIKNDQKEYKRLGSIVNDARMAGLIDWDAIEDRMRTLRRITDYADPSDFVSQTVEGYAENLWSDQDRYCEVWIEKDSLVGVIQDTCLRYRVPFFACRGYTSQSSAYEAGQRLKAKIDEGKSVTVFHLGDHDPSGMDMSRDNAERLNLFARTGDIELVRLALNQEQIKHFDLPPDPAKLSDSRSPAYMDAHGNTSWELDALPSREINRILVSAIAGMIDGKAFKRAEAVESANRTLLRKVSSHWTPVAAYAETL